VSSIFIHWIICPVTAQIQVTLVLSHAGGFWIHHRKPRVRRFFSVVVEGEGPSEKSGLRGKASAGRNIKQIAESAAAWKFFRSAPCSIQLVNQTHEFYGVKFFTDLFGKCVPIRSLRSHKRDPLYC
jgi:hypothetical protein